MNQLIKNKQGNRSEEVADIIERMPMHFGRWVGFAVVVFAAVILALGWSIKYPDTVTGAITINSNTAPVKLIAGTSGKLHICGFKSQDQVKEGEYIAIIQNAADYKDMQRIAGLVSDFNVNADSFRLMKNYFPEKVSLGELDLKYYSFYSALKSRCNYEEENTYEHQRKNLMEYLEWEKKLLQQTREEAITSREKLVISKKWFQRNMALQKKDMIPEIELDNIRKEYLSVKYNDQSLRKEMTNIQIQITETVNKLEQLKTEQNEKESQMRLELLSTFHDLTDQIRAWEQLYVFKAPFDGYVEFLKFWTENQFVKNGEEIFTIVPHETDILGQMHLPAQGAGKVKIGSRVIVKLDNYPFLEFGSVEGEVASISLITSTQQVEQTSVETYLVNIRLPQGLTTNYGETLDFKYEIRGTADIVIKDRRLIERLFDNLKYRTK